MKVAHIISGGDVGGAKTHVLTLLEKLNDKGVSVTLICIMESIFTQEAKALGIDIRIFEQKRRADLIAIKKIIGCINEQNFDIIHCHGARANFIALFLRKKMKIPMITTLHSDYTLDFTSSKYKQLIYTRINAFALGKFTYWCTVSSALKAMLVKKHFREDRIFVAYNGVDFDVKDAVLPKNEFLQSYGLPVDENASYVGLAARLTPVKGVDVFLKAAKTLKERTDLFFLLAGNGEDYPKCARYVQDNHLTNVYLLGHVKDIYSFYNAIDINTITSYTEGIPFSLLEGGKMKKATIASNVGGIPEMLAHQETALLFPPGDYLAFAECITEMLADTQKMRTLSERYYEYAKKYFSAEAMANAHIQIYEQMIKERI